MKKRKINKNKEISLTNILENNKINEELSLKVFKDNENIYKNNENIEKKMIN